MEDIHDISCLFNQEAGSKGVRLVSLKTAVEPGKAQVLGATSNSQNIDITYVLRTITRVASCTVGDFTQQLGLFFIREMWFVD